MKNIKHLSTLFFFGLFANTIFAQTLNVSGGFTSSIYKSTAFEEYTETSNTVEGNYTESAKINRLEGFNAGLSFEFKLNKTFSLEPGLRYQTRGFSYNVMANLVSAGTELYTYNLDITYKTNCFDLPLVLNAGTDIGNFRLYGRAGIYGGIRSPFYARLIINSPSESIYRDESRYLEEELVDLVTAGYLLGVGVKYKGFYLEANHNKGLLMSEDFGLSSDFFLNLGYKIKLGK